MDEKFFDQLAELSTAERLRVLAAIIGSTIHDAAEDPRQARDAADKVFILIEKSAGLRP